MLTKTERDEMRAFCADARARCITWNEADRICDIAVKALEELDAKDAELKRIDDDKAYLFQANVANEWEERYQCQEQRIQLKDAELATQARRLESVEASLVFTRDNLYAERATGAAMRKALTRALQVECGSDLSECFTQWHDDARLALQSDAGAKLLAEHAEHVTAVERKWERWVEKLQADYAAKHAGELAGVELRWEQAAAQRDETIAAQEKVLRLASDLLCELHAAGDRGPLIHRIFDVAQAIHRVQQSDAGAKLLADHAEELEAVERKWMAVANRNALEREAIAEELGGLLKAAEAEAERLRGVDLANRALCEWQNETRARLKAAEAETRRVVDLVKANDIAALIVDRADAIQRAEAAEKDAAAAREEVRALHQERKGEVWFWQADGEDHLESLACPVLIRAEALRKLLADRAAQAVGEYQLSFLRAD